MLRILPLDCLARTRHPASCVHAGQADIKIEQPDSAVTLDTFMLLVLHMPYSSKDSSMGLQDGKM